MWRGVAWRGVWCGAIRYEFFNRLVDQLDESLDGCDAGKVFQRVLGGAFVQQITSCDHDRPSHESSLGLILGTGACRVRVSYFQGFTYKPYLLLSGFLAKNQRLKPGF